MTPAVLQSLHDHGGRTYVLTLVRSTDDSAGFCLLETLGGPDGEPALYEPGSWCRERSDEGPCVLSTEWPDAALDEMLDDGFTVINALMDKLVDDGSWGFDGFTPIGGH